MKRGQLWDTFLPWIVSIAVLVLSFILYLTISGKLKGFRESLFGFLRGS